MVMVSLVGYAALKSGLVTALKAAVLQYGEEHDLTVVDLKGFKALPSSLEESAGSILHEVFDAWPDLENEAVSLQDNSLAA